MGHFGYKIGRNYDIKRPSKSKRLFKKQEQLIKSEHILSDISTPKRDDTIKNRLNEEAKHNKVMLGFWIVAALLLFLSVWYYLKQLI